MSEYKMVVSDLDGTLLNRNSEISHENLSAIHELANSGVYFVPSSGRTLSETPEVIRNSPDIRYIIHSNGAVILDKLTGERTLMCMSHDLSVYVLDVLNSYDTHITFRRNGECFADAAFQNDEAYKYFNVWECHKTVINDFAVFAKNFKELSYSFDNIEVFSVFFHNDDEKEACRKQLLKTGKLLIAEACDHNLEIFSIDAGKGNALRRLADMLGIDYAYTIMVGDSNNDITGIQAAGLGLAVKNASKALKAAADGIICSNEKHAIAYILSRYLQT